MVQGWSIKIFSMIKWIRTSRLPITNSLSEQENFALQSNSWRGATFVELSQLFDDAIVVRGSDAWRRTTLE